MTETPYVKGTWRSFNALPNILRTYFPNPANGGRDRSDELILEFRKVGGSGVKFEGLIDELKTVARDPSAAVEVFESALGGHPEEGQATAYFADLHDALVQSGRFAPEAIEAEQAAAKMAEQEAKPDTDELFKYYAGRRINLPGPLARFSTKLWVYLVVGFGVAAVSGVLFLLVPTSWGVIHAILTWPLRLLAFTGIIIAFISGLTMTTLRRERLKPEPTTATTRKSFWRFR